MKGSQSGLWRVLFAASVVAIGVADAIVLDLTRAYFGSGYNGVALRGVLEISAFFVVGAAFDAAAVALVWSAALLLARALRARPVRALATASLLGVALPLAFDLAMHRLHRVLGDVLELRLLLGLAAGSWGNAFGEAAQDLPPLALLGGLAGSGAVLGFAVLARLERARPSLADARLPRIRSLAACAAACAAVGAIALSAGARWAPALEFGWSEKPAGRTLRSGVSALSDFDRDGYGYLSQPADPAPFSATIHPYAVDLPANGIDEDGVGGDLPANVEVPMPLAVPLARPRPDAPSVALIFLESFRADLVGMQDEGRQVTPNLNEIERAGTRATAYAHVPVTWASRAALMQGRVVPMPRSSTLIDDFLARGYEVAWFSGQHDGLASEDARLGTDRATHFTDARRDSDRRTSRSAQPISLQVSWKTVTGRVDEYLHGRRSAKPLFLYVNVVDTHFPYWHRELDDILAVGRLPRDSIRPENRARVWRAYLNAAANVDRAIGKILASARASLGADTLVVVTGDHGQSFYENGLLGHGQTLDDSQTAVPFLMSVPCRVPEPLALSDVRGLLGHWLEGTIPSDRELAREEIFQHVGALEDPSEVGLRNRNGVDSAQIGSSGAEPSARELRAIRVWEALKARRETETAPAPNLGTGAARVDPTV